MTDFSIPQGDAETLRDVARAAQRASGTIGGTRRTAVTHAAGTVTSGLPTKRVADYTSARDSAVKVVDTVALSMSTVSGALSTYAEALEQAQHKIRHAKSQWDDAHALWVSAKHDGDADAQERYQREMHGHEHAADVARQSLRDHEQTTTTILAGEVHVWVPHGAASPLDAWAAASHQIVPPRLRLDRQRLEEGYEKLTLPKEAVSNAVKAGMKGWQSWQLLTWVRSASIATAAEEEFAKASLAYQLIKNASPDLGNAATYKAYLKAEQAMLEAFGKRWPADAIRAQKEFGFLRGLIGEGKAVERLKALYPGLSEAEIMGASSRFARLMGPLRAIGPWASRIFAPLAVVTGGLDVWSAATDDSLPTDIRVARGLGGGGSIVAGGATLLVMAGLVSNPVGWGIIIGGSAVAIGAWVYENREAVEKGLKWTGDKIEDGAEWAGDKLSDAGGAIKDGAGKVWHGIFG